MSSDVAVLRPAVQIRSPQDVSRIEETPLELNVPESSINDRLRQVARLLPSKLALRYLPNGRADDHSVDFTYSDLLRNIDDWGDLFEAHGGSDPVVALLLPNLPEAVVGFFAAQSVGRIALINPLLEKHHIGEILKAVRASLIVTVASEVDLATWEKVDGLRGHLPALRRIFVVGGVARPADRDLLWLTQLTTGGTEIYLPRRRLREPGQNAAYFHTGGTTGSPKIAPMTDFAQAFAAWTIRTVAGIDVDSVVVGGMPLYHAGGVYVNTVSPLLAGATAVVLGPTGYRNRAIYAEFWHIVAKYRCTYFLGVPTVFQALLSTVCDADITSLRYCSCGGAAVAPTVLEEFQKRFGVPVIEGYGITEGGVTTTRNPRNGENRLGSVGIRHPYQSLRVASCDDGGRSIIDCGVNEVGTLLLRGPNVFPGYLQPQYNAGAWVGDGWFNTGDLARIDADGYVWLVGRSKDLIIRGGHNIDPAAIEEVFHRHPAVSVVAAVGRPDEYAGELPVVYVQLRPGARVSEAELLQHARSNISERAALPTEVILVDSIPTTAVGKIFKPELRWDAARRTFLTRVTPLLPPGAEFRLEVAADLEFGSLATLTIAGIPTALQRDLQSRIGARLSPFTIRHKVIFS